MILAALLCMMGIFAWCQPSAVRRKTAFLYVTPTLLYAMFSGWLDDQWYYIGAALTDSLAIILLSFLVVVDRLTVRLAILSAASMCLNFVGLVLYEAYQPSTIYDALFIALYVGAVVALADQEGSNVGSRGADKLYPRHVRNAGTSHRISHRSDPQI